MERNVVTLYRFGNLTICRYSIPFSNKSVGVVLSTFMASVVQSDGHPGAIDTQLSVSSPTASLSPANNAAVTVDRYGFLVSDRRFAFPTKSPQKSKDGVWLENRRTQKWVDMLGHQNGDWVIYRDHYPAQVKKRIRKGIPEAVRGRVWCLLTGSVGMKESNHGIYRQFLSTSNCPCEETISRDIRRTFPKHYFFADETSLGQGALMNVLRSYSLYDPLVGYCQGMGFISAMFLSYMPEEETFWQLVACMNKPKYQLAELYRPGMPKVPQALYIFGRLLQRFLPQIAAHMEKEGVDPSMYASQWFITLYTYSFPFEFVTRVWDIFLHEGWKVVYRVALALMKLSKKTILTGRFETIMEFWKVLPDKIDPEEVLQVSLEIPLLTSDLEKLKDEYENEKK